MKTKRGKRKSEIRKKNQFTENSMFILGGNAAGLLNKKNSFLRNLSIFILRQNLESPEAAALPM